MTKEEQSCDDPKELFVVVDENDNILGYKTRKMCHRNKALIHRAVSIAVINKQGAILLQKRSQRKDLYPGLYALSASGHVDKNETYEEAAKRELFEELGVSLVPQFCETFIIRTGEETEMIALFTLIYSGPFIMNREEISELKFFTKKEAAKISNKLTPCALKSLKRLKFL